MQTVHEAGGRGGSRLGLGSRSASDLGEDRDLGLVRASRSASASRVTRAVAALAAAGALALSGCSLFFTTVPPTEEVVPAPTEDFSSFTEQVPNWASCGDGLQCADVFAPLDWEDADGDRITLRLVKQSALSGTAQGTLFVNPGGPGASGVDYIASYIDGAVGEALQESFDVIGWDPRGVGSSSAVSCLDDEAMDEWVFGLGATDGLESGSDAWIEAGLAEATEYGKACLDSTGPLLAYVDTISTVHDLDMLRAIVGDVKLNYLGYSYGTYIGARYADLFPEQVGRLVLDGALDPTSTEADVVREQTRGFEASLRSYVADCLTRNGCPYSGSVDRGMQQWRALLDRVEANPLRGSDGRMVTSGTMLTAIITPLYSQESWGWLDNLFVTASSGDADTALLLADFYYDRQDGVYQSNMMQAFSAINCLDYPREAELDVDRMRAEAAELEQIAPTIGAFQGFGDVFCAGWPVAGVEERLPVSADGADPILVIGTTGDPATPYRWAESLAKQLVSGVLVTFEGEGHTAYGNNDCINTVVEKYFINGTLPQDGVRCS